LLFLIFHQKSFLQDVKIKDVSFKLNSYKILDLFFANGHS